MSQNDFARAYLGKSYQATTDRERHGRMSRQAMETYRKLPNWIKPSHLPHAVQVLNLVRALDPTERAWLQRCLAADDYQDFLDSEH